MFIIAAKYSSRKDLRILAHKDGMFTCAACRRPQLYFLPPISHLVAGSMKMESFDL